MLQSCCVSSARAVRLSDAPSAPMRFWRPVPSLGLARRRAAAARCAGVSLSVSVLEAAEAAAALGGASSAQRLGIGRWDEEGVSYKECVAVRCYEVGINNTATIEAMANLLQEVACNHVQSLGFSKDGFGTTTAMRKLRLIWVTNRMHIEIKKYPAWRDVIEIETWCDIEGKIGTRRDWVIKDLATGEVIGRCTSSWAAMNQDTRKLERIIDEVREDYVVFCPNRFAFSKEYNRSLKKVPKLEEPGEYSRLGIVPRRADLDMNQHVNNVTYIGWILDSMPQHIIETHELETITLVYRRECQHDDIIDSLTSSEQADHKATNGSALAKRHAGECCHFLHLLRFSGSGLEINRARTTWRKLDR